MRRSGPLALIMVVVSAAGPALTMVVWGVGAYEAAKKALAAGRKEELGFVAQAVQDGRKGLEPMRARSRRRAGHIHQAAGRIPAVGTGRFRSRARPRWGHRPHQPAGQIPLGVIGCIRRRAASVMEPDREG